MLGCNDTHSSVYYSSNYYSCPRVFTPAASAAIPRTMAPLSSSSDSEHEHEHELELGLEDDQEFKYDATLSASTATFSKQSRYFEFIKNNSTISLDCGEEDESEHSDGAPEGNNGIDINNYNDNDKVAHGFTNTQRFGGYVNKLADAFVHPNRSPLRKSPPLTVNTTLPIKNTPLPKTPVHDQRTQSSSSSSTPSPNRRFSKYRLNNVEKRNYVSPTIDDRDARMSFFNQPMLSPIDSINYSSSSALFESPSSLISRTVSSSPTTSSPLRSRTTLTDTPPPSASRSSTIFSPSGSSIVNAATQTAFSTLPLEMKIIVNSRAEHNLHDMMTFTNLSYAEFWNITPEEGNTYKAWNKGEFETQSLLFEIFINFRKIKFNLHRLLFIYGEELRDNGVINDAFYEKTFTVLHELYGFLDKLLIKKLKPLFDDHFFVNDTQVLKVLNKWFEQLNTQYRYISGSVVFLAKLSANDEIRKFILGVSKKDLENTSNRSAVSPIELLSSYFIKLFTSVQLLFGRLKSIYKDTKNTRNLELASKLEELTKKINNISDSTSELDKKIRFNERLSYRTEIDFSHMEMVDIFSEDRRSKEPLFIEMKTPHAPTFSQAILAPFDNYLLILTIKSSRREEYVLAKHPIPIQYLTFDTTITHDNAFKYLHIKDINMRAKYTFRKPNDFTVAILDRFCKDLRTAQDDFWCNGVNDDIELKILTVNNFISAYVDNGIYDLNNTVPQIHNLVDVTLEKNIDRGFLPRNGQMGNNDDDGDDMTISDVSPLLTNVLSVDYFTYRSNQYADKVCIIGTNVGIFIGMANDFGSFHQVHQLKNTRKIVVLNNEVVICISGESLYRLSVEKLYSTYRFKLPACDINVFEENKRYIADFTVGYQTTNATGGSGKPYLFAWKEKLVYYTELSKNSGFKFQWNNFKTHYNVVKLQTVYANNFGVAHIVDGVATWNLSKLSDIRSIALNNLDVKDILKGGEVPVAIFPFPNKTLGISEVLVVYSRFCTRVKNVKGKYVQSCDEVTWFGLKCHSASFDCEEKILITVGEQNVETRQMYDDPKAKSTLIGCLVGNDMKLVNEMPGKPIVKCHNFRDESAPSKGGISDGEAYKNQVVFRIKKRNNSNNNNKPDNNKSGRAV